MDIHLRPHSSCNSRLHWQEPIRGGGANSRNVVTLFSSGLCRAAAAWCSTRFLSALEFSRNAFAVRQTPTRRPPPPPWTTTPRGCARAPHESAANARIAAGPSPAGRPGRVTSWYPWALLHKFAYRQPTIPRRSKCFTHACRKDTMYLRLGLWPPKRLDISIPREAGHRRAFGPSEPTTWRPLVDMSAKCTGRKVGRHLSACRGSHSGIATSLAAALGRAPEGAGARQLARRLQEVPLASRRPWGRGSGNLLQYRP